MAVLTYRLIVGADGNFAGLSETDQAAASRADGWTVAKLAAAQMSEFDAGTKQASGSFSSAAKPASFLTGTTANAIKTPPLKGDFAAGTWTFTFAMRCTTASSQRGRMRLRVFRAQPNGSGATELTGATQIGTTVASALSTTVDTPSTVTWSAPAISGLDFECLFFVIAWEITTASGSNSGDALMRTGSSATVGSLIATADFTAVVVNPDDTTLLDDFNRADGKVSVGAGAAIWATTDWQGNVGVSHTSIVGNAIAAPSTFSAGALSLFRLASDCDLTIDCVTPGTGTDRGQFDICGSGLSGTYDGYSFRFAATTVILARLDNGSATTIGSASITLAAGDTIWIQKRGSSLRLFRKASGGNYSLILAVTDATYDFGVVSIDPGNTTVGRWDNLRGGPQYVPPTPANETLYDDFNRADDFVYSGAGTSLWETNRLDVAVATQAKVISNQLGLTAAAYNQAVSKGTLPTDFDLVWDAPVAYTGECTLWFALQTPVATNQTGFALVMSGATSYAIRNYVNGVNQGVLTSATGPTITAGDMFWLYRRGTLLRLYYKRGAGDWTKILEVTSSLYPTGGTFAFELSDVATRIDNVRGGIFSGLGPSIVAADSVTTSDSAQIDQGFGLTLDVADSVTTSDSLVLAAFDPSVISGLALWLDASVLTPGAAVSAWPNLASGGFALTGVRMGSPPVVQSAVAGINGLPVVRFLKGQGAFASGATGIDRDYTFFVVARMLGTNNLRIVGGNNGTPNFLVGWWGGVMDVAFCQGWLDGNSTGTPATTAVKSYALDSATAPFAPRLFSDGVQIRGSGGGAAGGWASNFGLGEVNTGENSDFELGEILFYNRKLSDAERQMAEAYLRTKWLTPGVALTLGPSDGLADSVTTSDDGGTFVQDFGISAVDSVATSDVAALAEDYATSYTDTVTTSDAYAQNEDIVIAVSVDTVTPTDADSWVEGFAIGVVDGLADGVTTSDFDDWVEVFNIAVADTNTTSDALSLDFAYTFADTVTTSDSLQLDFVIPLDIADSVTVTDEPLIATSADRPQFSRAFSAAYELLAALSGPFSQESGGGGKTVIFSKSGGGVEVVGGGAHPQFYTDWTISAADSVLATDGLALVQAYVQADADTVTPTDLDSWVENYVVTFTPDSVTVTDSLDAIDVSIAPADTVTTSDALTLQIDFVLDTLADQVTTSDAYSQVAALGIDDPLDSVITSDLPDFAESYVSTFTDSVATSDQADLAQDSVTSYADTVTTSDLFDLVNVIPKAGGATEGSFTGLSKLTKVAQTGGGIEAAVGGAVWASNALKSGGGIEGSSAGGDAVRAILVTKSGGATSAESGAITANVTTAVSKSGGAVEGSVGGIAPTSRLISESGGGISAEYGAVHVGLVKFGGAQSTESSGISRLVTAAKAGQGTEEEIGGGAVSTLRVVSKSGGATEGSVAGGTWTVTLIITKAGGAAEPQTAGAARATFLVKSLGGISAETASGHPTIVALFVKSGGGISSENGSGSRNMLYVLTKSGGGFEIQVSGGQRQSIHRLVGGGQLSETGGGHGALLMARSGGATTGEIGGLSRLTFYSKRHGGISPERGGGYGRRIKTYQEGGAESPESGGGALNYTIAIPPGEGQEGELVGTDYGATLIGASSSSSTGQLVGATSGAMVLSGIEKAILVAAQEEVTFE